MKVAIVGCGGTKLLRPAPARELYTSTLFRKSLAYAERIAERVFIASALHGLVAIDQELEPYEQQLVRGAGRARWGADVVEALREAVGDAGPVELVLLAGVLYADPIETAARAVGWVVTCPLEGLTVGYRLRRLNELLSMAGSAA